MRENRPDAVCANFSLTIIYFVLQFWGGESADLVTCGNSSLGMLYKVLALLVAPLQLSHKWQKTPAVAALHHKSMESCKPSWDLRVSSSPEQPYRIWAHQVSLSMNTRGGGGFQAPYSKRPGRESDQSQQSSSKIKNVWSHTATPECLHNLFLTEAQQELPVTLHCVGFHRSIKQLHLYRMIHELYGHQRTRFLFKRTWIIFSIVTVAWVFVFPTNARPSARILHATECR